MKRLEVSYCKDALEIMQSEEILQLFGSVWGNREDFRNLVEQTTFYIYKFCPSFFPFYTKKNKFQLLFSTSYYEEEVALLRSKLAENYDGCCGLLLGKPFVALSSFASLSTLLHEMTHLYFIEELYEKANCISIQTKRKRFEEEERILLELFVDYYSLKLLAIYPDVFPNWKYQRISTDSAYYPFQKLMILLDGCFGDLVIASLKEGNFTMLKEVVGKKNFEDFMICISFIYENCERIHSSHLNALEGIVARMINHALNYQNSYSDCVLEYIEELKKEGKKVRILKPNMDKLVKQEQLIKRYQYDS